MSSTAGSTRGFDMADQAVLVQSPALPVADARVRTRRWAVLRRALTARMAPFGGFVLLSALVIGVLAPFIAPYDPLKQDLVSPLLAPSSTHLLGTDNLGRDVLARVIWGTRVS